MLTHGYLSCASAVHVTSQVMMQLFDVIVVATSATQHLYLALKTLLIWLNKLRQAWEQLKIEATFNLRTVFARLLRLALDCIDSPIEGVTSCVVDVFKLTLTIMIECQPTFEWREVVVRAVKHLSTKSKGRYLLLAVITAKMNEVRAKL